ncbi:MAG TPA: hypothetical protein PLU94_06170 [Methanoregulaceae archaeon]|nr:hypothetical protein [Methanoregulaceae archaeon]
MIMPIRAIHPAEKPDQDDSGVIMSAMIAHLAKHQTRRIQY